MGDVSVIIPVHNASQWIDECMESVFNQSYDGGLEVSIFNDSSTDDSADKIEKWRKRLEEKGIRVIVTEEKRNSPRGVGYAKNAAVMKSSGNILCFLDADDVMMPDRVAEQFEVTHKTENAIVGTQFQRIPPDSTVRYTQWANRLTEQELYTQAYTSHGPTVVMPTWACSRAVYSRVGGFSERGKGVPEDLIFFYKHLELGGKLKRINKELLLYRYHAESATFSVKEETIWNLRITFIQTQIIDHWDKFTIWNAGKQGRQLYRDLSDHNRSKVEAFCDVDEKKINKMFYTHERSSLMPKPQVPILHFTQASPPFIICVKMDLTGGEFEKNLVSLNLTEGRDFIHFN